MQVFKHLRLHRSTQRRQLSNIPCSAMPDFFQTLSGELRESLEDSPILRHCLVHIVLSLLTKRRLRIWELDAPGELQLNLCPALCIWFSYLCFAELHFFDQNHEGLAQLGLGRTHEPGSHCWVLDTQLPDGERETEVPYSKRVSIQKQLTGVDLVFRFSGPFLPYLSLPKFILFYKPCHFTEF